MMEPGYKYGQPLPRPVVDFESMRREFKERANERFESLTTEAVHAERDAKAIDDALAHGEAAKNSIELIRLLQERRDGLREKARTYRRKASAVLELADLKMTFDGDHAADTQAGGGGLLGE